MAVEEQAPPPLAGVRFIAVEQFGAGPWGTMLLADLGAEIIKVENPATGGDVARYVQPHTAEQDSVYFQSFNRNKKKHHAQFVASARAGNSAWVGGSCGLCI